MVMATDRVALKMWVWGAESAVTRCQASNESVAGGLKVGFRFRKTIRLAKGVRLNVGKSGISSLSVGGKWAGYTIGRRGISRRVSLPGTGLSYTTRPASRGGLGCLLSLGPALLFGFLAVIVSRVAISRILGPSGV
jgi:hypothetical protein